MEFSHLVIGTKVHHWTVIGEPIRVKDKWHYPCRCKCGREITVVRGDLIRTDVRQSRQCKFCKGLHHGLSRSKLYWVFHDLKKRCGAHPNYKGRGITICAKWSKFEPFAEWALANGYQEGLQIDRKNNDLGYSPDNCRWTTRKVNNRNKRATPMLTAFGETKSLMDWWEDPRCPTMGRRTLYYRFKSGWDHERAVTTNPAHYHH